MEFDHLLVDVDAEIAFITINRPDVLNALSLDVELDILKALRWVEDSDQVKAAVITGAGDKAFSAGADIKAYASMTLSDSFGYLQKLHETLWTIENLRKPTLAAINGLCLGGGFELALSCTLRFASDAARMGLPEINVGCIPGNGGIQRLSRLVGKGRTAWYALTGELMSAQEALELAVVNKVFPQEKLLDACREFLRTVLLQKAPIAVWAVRKSLNIGPEIDLKSACELDLQLETVCFASEDFREGVTAFIEKRQPVYNGK